MQEKRQSLHKEKPRSVPLIQKSLAIVLQSLQGEQVKFELKNDQEVTGMVESVGHGMDTQLFNASSTSLSSKQDVEDLDSLFIFGENIRYVHIPTHINVTAHMTKFMRQIEQHSYKKRKIVDRPSKQEMDNSSASSTTTTNSSIVYLNQPLPSSSMVSPSSIIDNDDNQEQQHKLCRAADKYHYDVDDTGSDED